MFGRLPRLARPMSAPLATIWKASSSTAGSGASTASTGFTLYEGQRAVDEYVQMHFGAPEDVIPYNTGATDGLRFPERCADEVVAALKRVGRDVQSCEALDAGCAVGGASFALARAGLVHVDGVDFSNAFVSAAQAMQDQGSVEYSALVEGTRVARKVARVELGSGASLVRFNQGDACALEVLRDSGKLQESGYDAVLASNLLCRLPHPRAFLRTCSEWAVKPGGVFVLLTPFSWLEQWTPQADWIGGGDAVSSEVLAREMESLGFRLESRADVPFLIREHARKFQYGISECSVWQK